MTRRRPTATLAASVVTAATVALATGCGVFSEQTTQLQYTPSDGAQADVGGIAVRNIMFVAEDEQSPGSLVGVILNSGSEDVQVSLSSENGVQATFDVPAGESISLGPDGDETVVVDPVGVLPGRTVPLTVTGGDQTVEIVTPVLDGTLSEYAELVPTATAESA